MVIVNDDADVSHDSLHGRVDPSQLEEIRKGIIMPGLGGNRANTEAPARTASRSDPSTPSERNASTAKDLLAPTGTPASSYDPAARAPPPTLASLRSLSSGADVGALPSRSRAQPTLKASMLKKRMAGPTSVAKAASGAKSSAGPKVGQGTPARATRYSLPVRAEKPVRTSKTTGKHVVLPSESQLAPLPGEEEEDEEEDDDDDDDISSSEDVSDLEVASRADDELADDLDEEEREKAREAAKGRREEAQRKLEEARKDKAARRQAQKPQGAPGHPMASAAAAKSAYPGLRGPAHARAPPRVPKSTGPVFHTFERLPPSARVHTQLPRLSSYAVAPAIHLPTLIGFLRREHGVRPRLYDECAYVVYFKPLLPGFGRAEVRSAPEPHFGSPGAESRREREIVEREESGYVGSYFAATNKDDEGDHIDEQGYIMGGEGRNQEEEEEEQARRRRQLENGAEGDATETETEREGGDGKGDRQRAAEYSEHSEPEIETEHEAQATDETPLLAQTSPNDEGGDESGILTPRALQPLRPSSDDVDIVQEALSDANSTIVDQSTISNADRAGAQDLREQQQFIESGATETADMPAMRSADSDREEDGPASDRHQSEGMVEGPNGNAGKNGSNGHRYRHHWDRDDARAARRASRTRKRMRGMGPNMASHNHDCSVNLSTSRSILEALQVAELVILPYGVLVMYNMSAAEERSIINDVISSGCVRGGPPTGPDNEETEAFHFCYDPSVPAPRIFNDFFTFRASNHLLKLSLAHAIAQSTKLSVFEESMQQTLELTSHIPKELASTGELQLKRREALKLTGRLFKLRVDVNLTSNVLDTPELFWSEASLKALYDAIREYLEIDQRVENLNERLAVGNDLLEVIHDHLGSQSMNQITWIIIILIVVACFVACGEILARLVLHSRSRSAENLLRKASAEQLLEAASMWLMPVGGQGPSAAAAGRLLIE